MITDTTPSNLKAKSSNLPTVSVILTSYNHAAYIAAAIDSVLNQTFADFELLIIDDGSADNSREIIKTYDDPRIKTFLYEVNRGPVIAIRDAVKSARGKYIAVHHSDDLWAPDKLEKQVAFLEANPKYAACFTWAEFVDERGNVQELARGDAYKNVFDQKNRSRAEWLNYFFYNANCLCHPSAMLRREAYENFRLLDVHGFWQLPDYLMWVRLCFHAELFILPERLTKFRLRRTRQENTSATTFDRLVRADTEFFFIAREFADNFTDDEFFLEVFPEAQKFVVDGQINRRYAFAQMCLARESNAIAAFNLAGLCLLKELLSSPDDAAQIKKLYGYDEKTFLRDSGTFDVFNLEQKLSMLHAEIYVGDDDGFEKVAAKIISVDPSRKFYGRIEFNVNRHVKRLRFDPDIKRIAVKINHVLINGVAHEISASNADETLDDFLCFWTTSDPQIFFDVDDLSDRVIFEVFGEKKRGFAPIVDNKIKNLVAENEQLAARNDELHKTIEPLNHLLTAANEKKLSAPIHAFREWLNYNNRDKALSAVRLFYKALPLADDTKSELKDKFYTTFAPLLKGTQRYRNWQMTKLWQVEPSDVDPKDFVLGDEKFFVDEFHEQPGKIAIQAHIFYLDLLEDMASYCANMPYKFDALISIIDETAADDVRAAFEKIPNVEKCIVRVVPNRGRDVAPFLVGFGDLVPAYDFVAHIHSKKSLYKGSDQKIWRDYLFEALLGSPERVGKIFAAFVADDDVGVIYPRPSESIPYPSFTWMSNRAVGQALLNRAGISPNKTDYFDFPAGTMFWARTRALKKFFALNLTIDDFPPELAQNDGTIAHAFERSILLAAKSEGMKYYEFAPDSDAYTVNFGSKNIWQYLFSRNCNVTEFEWLLAQGDITSFAVFDTLIMRYVAKQSHVNEIIRFKVEDLLGRDFDFPTLRETAERHARHKKGGDVTITEIYRSFDELTNLDDVTCKKIRELEISTELKLCLPREELVEWFREIVRRGHEVWLIEDTCLRTSDLKRLLKKCGVTGCNKFLISCETGQRKDTAELWNHLANQGFSGKLIHVGSNETSDAQFPGDRNFGIYHLMSALNLFSHVPFGRVLLESIGGDMSLYAGICLGVELAKNFQSPFRLRAALTENTHRLIVTNFRELGRWLYGVPLLTFTLQLIHATESNIKRIVFPREAQALLQLYQFVAEKLDIQPIAAVAESVSIDDKTFLVDISERALLKTICIAAGQKHFDEANKIFDGVKDFCRDVTEIFGDILLRVPIDEIFVDAWIDAFVSDEKIIAPELKKSFDGSDYFA